MFGRAFGQYAADTAPRVGHIACIARDQVHVNVHPRLSARMANIDADIVSVRREFVRDLRLCTIEQR